MKLQAKKQSSLLSVLKVPVALVAMILMATSALAQPTGFSVEVAYACKLTSNKLLVLENGKPKWYNGVEGELAVNDITFLNMDHDPWARTLRVSMKSKASPIDEFLFHQMVSFRKILPEVEYYSIEDTSDAARLLGGYNELEGRHLNLKSSVLDSGLYLDIHSETEVSAILTKMSNNRSHVMAFSCVTQGQFSELLYTLKATEDVEFSDAELKDLSMAELRQLFDHHVAVSIAILQAQDEASQK